jgi:hypothetical protein
LHPKDQRTRNRPEAGGVSSYPVQLEKPTTRSRGTRIHETSKHLPPIPDTAELQRQVESFQQSIHRLQLEHDILKKANELLKKCLGVHPQLLNNREKTLLVTVLTRFAAQKHR